MNDAEPSPPARHLVAASRVNGTNVYNTLGEKLGTIHDVMIDKVSGRVAYAILSFGGFLGIGDHHHPLPWTTLAYDRDLGGFVVDLDRPTLEGAPRHPAGQSASLEDGDWARRVDEYYKSQPYWQAVP